MILHKETFQKFGYWPEDLPRRSKQKILVKCNLCGIVREIMRRSFQTLSNQGYSKKCRHCGSKEYRDQNKREIKDSRIKLVEHKRFLRWKEAEPIKIDLDFAFKLYKGSCLTRDGSLKNSFRLPIPYAGGLGKVESRTRLSIPESFSYYKGLGLTRPPYTTNELKTAVVDYILTFDALQINCKLSELLAPIIKRRGLIKVHQVETLLSYNIWHDLFDKLGIEYHLHEHFATHKGKKRRVSNIVITNGSFFIDGRWLHVG